MPRQNPRLALQALERRAKKSLGQHFLKDDAVIERILAACKLDKSTGVLEIGPGLGAMTGRLLEKSAWVFAVETDRQLAENLKRDFAAQTHLTVHCEDILKTDLASVLPGEGEFHVVANLPYNISTAIVFHLLNYRHRIPWLGIMVQKEVADRLQSGPDGKNYGRLSVLPQISYRIATALTISGQSFFPPTKVTSSFITFERRETPLIDLSDARFAAFFDDFLLQLFRFRRKTLRNVVLAMRLSKTLEWDALLARVAIDPKRRAETLEFKELEALAQAVFQELGE